VDVSILATVGFTTIAAVGILVVMVAGRKKR
jgi:hypothetical protein